MPSGCEHGYIANCPTCHGREETARQFDVLHARIDRLTAENERLREHGELGGMDQYAIDLANAAVENGKLRDRVRELEGALRDVDEWMPALKPSGHDGDEESGQCDEDCQRCQYDAIEARIDAALPAPPQGAEIDE